MLTEPRPRAPRPPSARDIVDALRSGEPGSEEIFEAFAQLDALPPDEVREALASWVGSPREGEHVDDATRRARGLPLLPLRLHTVSVAKDADVLDQGAVAEDQLRLAGRTWDGADMTAEERLDGEIEGSFAGTVERRVLAVRAEPSKPPLFDVVLFAEGAGAVFAAGTTTMIGLIADGKVEMRDRRARAAIEEALSAPELAKKSAKKTATKGASKRASKTAKKKTSTAKKTTAAKGARAKRARRTRAR